MKIKTTVAAISLMFGSAAFAQVDSLDADTINVAQQAWANGIVSIGAAHTAGEDAKIVASQLLEELYAFDQKVLFKPTKAAADPFRNSYDEALSYFVGGSIEEDTGFAIQPWTAVRFENEDMLIHGDYAVAMGHYYFTGTDGKETKVEYTFGYRLTEDGKVKIDLHHSSLPFGS